MLLPSSLAFVLIGQLTPLRLAMQAHRGPIRLLHIDCDLYSSTKDVFDAAAHRLQPGSVARHGERVGLANQPRFTVPAGSWLLSTLPRSYRAELLATFRVWSYRLQPS